MLYHFALVSPNTFLFDNTTILGSTIQLTSSNVIQQTPLVISIISLIQLYKSGHVIDGVRI